MRKSYRQEVAEHNTRLIKDPVYWMMERMADLEAERLPSLSSFEPTPVIEVSPISRYLNEAVSLDKFEQLQGELRHLEKTLNAHCGKKTPF